MTVEASYAAWLKADRLVAERQTTSAPAWGDRGTSVTLLSPYADLTGATAELARFAGLFARPLVKDRVTVMGERRDLLGRCIRGVSDHLDYDPAGDLVIVIGVDEQTNGTTLLTVLKRLAV